MRGKLEEIMKATIEERMINALNETNISDLFTEAGFEMYTDETCEEYSEENHPLMFNKNTDELFFLNYGSPNDGWVKIAEQQNPWTFICYLTAQDVDNGCDEYIENCINNDF